MKNAAIYARYSSSAQTEQSIEGQLRVCKQFAEKNGYNVIYEYIDRAISGTSDKRPAFMQMIKDSNQKEFEYVLCYKLDRFSRNQYDSVVYKHKLAENGIKVVSATESIGDNTEGKLVECLLEVMAEVYSIDLSQKVKRGIKENILKGKTFGGFAPLGYKQVDQRLYIDEDKAPIIEYLFKEYASGKTLKQITKELNDMHYTAQNGKPLKIYGLCKALSNKKYIGMYEYEDVVKNDFCPPLVDKDIFDIVQKRLEQNKKTPAKAKAKTEYVLTGKIFCGLCGESMYGVSGTSKQKTKHYYYYCKKRYKFHECSKTNELKNVLEQEVVNAVLEHILTPKRIEQIIDNVLKEYETNINTVHIKEIEKRIKKVDDDLEKCFRMALNYTSKDMIAKADQYAKDLEVQKEDLQNDLRKLKLANGVKHTKEDLLKFFDMFINQNKEDKEYQRKIISLFLNKVYVFDDKFLIYCNTDFDGAKITFEQMKKDVAENNIKFHNLSKSSNIKYSGAPKNHQNATKYFVSGVPSHTVI